MNPTGPDEEAIFCTARQLGDPSQVDAYLSVACDGHPDLRLRVERLLQVSPEAERFFTRHALHPLGYLPEAIAVCPFINLQSDALGLQNDPQAGDRIGSYQLLEKLGEGGCGVVFLAEQQEPVRRSVALKLLKSGIDSRQVIDRFAVERQALALMEHPNIAKFLDAGVAPVQRADVKEPNPVAESSETNSRSFLFYPRPYFVMELVRGPRITDYCRQKNLSTPQRLELFITVCHAVQHAHQKGIIHRDLKPSNILVMETGSSGPPCLKVIDFGIAKATGQGRTDSAAFTQCAALLGTPAYMSPEQAAMTAVDIDTRSDIYSLGVLLYELLTGTTPFDAAELQQAGFDGMRRMIQEREPMPPSRRVRCSSKPRPAGGQEQAHWHSRTGVLGSEFARSDLDWIVMKCLEKERSRRYETASGLAADVERHLQSEPVTARPPSAVYRVQRLVQRNKMVFAAVGMVIAALLTGLTLAMWALAGERAARRMASTEAAKSREVATFLQDMVKGVGPAAARGRDTQMLQEILQVTAARIGRDLRGQPEVEVELRNTVGEVYWALGDYQSAEAMHRAALTIARREWGSEDMRVATTLHALTAALRKRGSYREAEPLDREALRVKRLLAGEKSPEVVSSLNSLAGDLDGLDDHDGAERLLREALTLGREIHGQEHRDIGVSLNLLALVLRARGNHTESIELNREALLLRRKLLGPDHPETFQSLHNLALNLMDQGDLGEAERLLREVLQTEKAVAGQEHPGVALTLYNLGTVALKRGRLAEAEALHREALELRRKRLGLDHPLVAVSLGALAETLWSSGSFAEAESALREVLALEQRRPGHDSLRVANTYHNLSVLLRKSGDVANSEIMRREAARETLLHARTHETNSVAVLESAISDLAEVLYRQGRYEEAEPLYRELYQNRAQRQSDTDEGVVSAKASLGRLLTDWAWAEQFHSAPNLTGGFIPTTHSSLSSTTLKTASIATDVTTRVRRAREATHLLRECLDIRSKHSNNSRGLIGDTKSRLGGAILALAIIDPAHSSTAPTDFLKEAEALLLSGDQLLQASSSAEGKHKRDALQRLVRFYTVSSRSEEIAVWQRKLDAFDLAATKSHTRGPRNP
jgi:serine/threonine protein kinase/tetratricopeptide (TPR) repeat protein